MKKVNYALKQSIGWHGQTFTRGLQDIPFEMAISMEMLNGSTKVEAMKTVETMYDEQNVETVEAQKADTDSEDSQKDESTETSTDQVPEEEDEVDEAPEDIWGKDPKEIPYFGYFESAGYHSYQAIQQLAENGELTAVNGISEARASEITKWFEAVETEKDSI